MDAHIRAHSLRITLTAADDTRTHTHTQYTRARTRLHANRKLAC